MICLNCGFWEKDEERDFDSFLFSGAIKGCSYLLKPRGYCKREGIVTCYDEGCEWFKNTLEEDDD